MLRDEIRPNITLGLYIFGTTGNVQTKRICIPKYYTIIYLYKIFQHFWTDTCSHYQEVLTSVVFS